MLIASLEHVERILQNRLCFITTRWPAARLLFHLSQYWTTRLLLRAMHVFQRRPGSSPRLQRSPSSCF